MERNKKSNGRVKIGWREYFWSDCENKRPRKRYVINVVRIYTIYIACMQFVSNLCLSVAKLLLFFYLLSTFFAQGPSIHNNQYIKLAYLTKLAGNLYYSNLIWCFTWQFKIRIKDKRRIMYAIVKQFSLNYIRNKAKLPNSYTLQS